MATWIAHLRIAEVAAPLLPDLDLQAFAIGSVAPDAGVPNSDWSVFTPPPEISHLFRAGREPFPSDDAAFYKQYLDTAESAEMDRERHSFLLGYLGHLLVDNLWRQMVVRPTRRAFSGEMEADQRFIWTIKKDWYGLDFAFLLAHPEWRLWHTFRSACYERDLIDRIPRETIVQKLEYIRGFYERSPREMQKRADERPRKYLTEEHMDRFVRRSAERLKVLLPRIWLGQLNQTNSEDGSLLRR